MAIFELICISKFSDETIFGVDLQPEILIFGMIFEFTCRSKSCFIKADDSWTGKAER